MEMDYIRLLVKEDRDRAYWAAKISEADRYYADNPKHWRVTRWIIGIYGLVILRLSEFAEKMQGINRGAA